jgi:hypothetical protein
VNDRDTTDLLAEACTELAALLELVADTEVRNGASAAGLHTVDMLIADRDIQFSARHMSSRKSTMPGNTNVLEAVMYAHQAIRETESDLRYAAAGHSGTPRGGSDGNTMVALANIPRLGAGADENTRYQAIRRLRSAALAIERLPAIDEAIDWAPLPRQPGQPPPLCAWCGTYSLRYAVVTGIIRCMFPGCLADDEQPPQGRLDISQTDGSPCIVWRSGWVQYA